MTIYRRSNESLVLNFFTDRTKVMLQKTEKLTLLEVLLIPKVLPQEERFIVISKFSICQAELY